ncbi:Radical SAM superfamily protein [Planctomycetes bacterium Pan216]|uniref:Radical SAM superfamily protein n=1 Tax=Kolteria novifilia TaxID=2527975 RepID=A0A518BCY5_9BACT|nr:Radical SAM superfamily protein [Planctomycetes bacterium Pan216]
MAESLREIIMRDVLLNVQTPGQYIGGEFNAVAKDHATLEATFCLAFPDTYTLGMSHHGMQILYNLVNSDERFACERAFCPNPDFEAELRKRDLPLYGLETFTPLGEFDMIGFSLQYEICYSNILTMLDLSKIPLHSVDRGDEDPLIIAGGPGAQNPEVLAPFVDLFIIGDGEESLLEVMEKWSELKRVAGIDREERIARLVASFDWAYAPRFYQPEYHADGTIAAMNRTRPDVPQHIRACVITQNFDDIPIPTEPVMPNVECAHDRFAIEIMRGCPWQCRFCQSTVIKRPLRVRSVDAIVEAAKEAYEKTGYEEISILSLSSSDYPHFEELVNRLAEEFSSKRVSISVPSLRVNDQFRNLPKLVSGVRKGGLTLAPEVARDDMRDQIRKPINNDNLYEGCRKAFEEGWRRVKLYFMCGLPGERTVDLDGIVDVAERISTIGKEAIGRYIPVTASVSNFVPKPHTPYQWNGMRDREYFQWAHRYLRDRVSLRSVKVKCHTIDTSLLEGIMTRGDRRIAPVLEEAWRRGARLDAWDEHFNPALWWQVFEDLGVDMAFYSQRERPTTEILPWDHVNVKKGRDWLEKDHHRSVVQLNILASAE